MLYQLNRDYFDGKVLQRAGAVLDFEQGQAPRSAKPAPEPVPEPKTAKAEK